jgi:hypothetical protein
VVAWDIKTCPLPEELLTPAQAACLDRQAERLALQDGLPLPQARQKAAALSPVAGRICSIAAVRGGRYGEAGDPIVYLAPTPADEPALLEAFWADMERLPADARWVTSGGKRFDVSFTLGRTLRHRMEPSRADLIGTHPSRTGSHVDLHRLFAGLSLRLQDLCALLGVPSPKEALRLDTPDMESPEMGSSEMESPEMESPEMGSSEPDAEDTGAEGTAAEGMDGSMVAGAMAAGRFGAVAAYNAADALATLRCFQLIPEKAVAA